MYSFLNHPKVNTQNERNCHDENWITQLVTKTSRLKETKDYIIDTQILKQ
jgi:hypothetical protein